MILTSEDIRRKRCDVVVLDDLLFGRHRCQDALQADNVSLDPNRSAMRDAIPPQRSR
jgi:hypothetical protein